MAPTWILGVMGALPMLDKGGPVLGASFDGTLSAVRIELTLRWLVVALSFVLTSRRVALWLLPSSERISAVVRA